MWEVIQSIPLPHLMAFLATGIVLNLTPGSDVIFATASGISGGSKAGAPVGLGVGLGAVGLGGLAALGLSALVASHPGALVALKGAGAAHLLWLAWQAWHAVPTGTGAAATTPGRALSRGFLTNALNPKVVLFFLALLPQVTDPAFGPIWAQVVRLGGLFTLTGTVLTMGYGVLAGLGGAALVRQMSVLNRVAAGLYAVLAVLAVRRVRG